MWQLWPIATPTVLLPFMCCTDALGGNCLTLMVGTVRQGDWEASTTTIKQLTTARGARNFPIINHSRARGLLHKLRFRMMAIVVRAWCSVGAGGECAVSFTEWLCLG
jgi:hypothetical protein